MIVKRMCCVFISVFLLTACKTSKNRSQISSEGELEGYDRSYPDYMSEGFTLKVERGSSQSSSKPAGDSMLVIEDRKGTVLGKAPYADEQLALGSEVLADGSVIYKWPTPDEISNRDFEKLGALMEEYSELVGTLLKRDAKGPGEVSWRESIRRDQSREVEAARRNALKIETEKAGDTGNIDVSAVSKAWCNANVTQLVERLVPEGSKYRQYGNCGEGGRIGACLAKQAGFKESEIRICLSANDHFFAMVHRGEEKGVDRKWCILDRWDIVGHFACDVDVDTTARQVTYKGELVDAMWFERVGCTTLDKFLVDPKKSLYDPVGRY